MPAPYVKFGLDGEWEEGEVSYNRAGRFDRDTAEQLCITNEHHKMRVERAEEILQQALEAHPVPEAAQNGGTLDADPNSAAEQRLNKGTEVIDNCGTCIMSVRRYSGLAPLKCPELEARLLHSEACFL
jgi:hypothetical protein